MNQNINVTCPCQSQYTFEQCCLPFIQGAALPSHAEQLMRSRFSAFYLIAHPSTAIHKNTLVRYLVDTHHPDYRSEDLSSSLHAQPANAWCSLRILNTEKGSPNDTQGRVEFVAFYRTPDAYPYAQMHENSAFIKQNDQWRYTTGQQCKEIKLSRNDKCWCGSHKKLKACHPE